MRERKHPAGSRLPTSEPLLPLGAPKPRNLPARFTISKQIKKQAAPCPGRNTDCSFDLRPVWTWVLRWCHRCGWEQSQRRHKSLRTATPGSPGRTAKGLGRKKKNPLICYYRMDFNSVKMPLPHPRKLLSSTTSSGEGLPRAMRLVRFEPASCRFQVMSPIPFWRRSFPHSADAMLISSDLTHPAWEKHLRVSGYIPFPAEQHRCS